MENENWVKTNQRDQTLKDLERKLAELQRRKQQTEKTAQIIELLKITIKKMKNGQ